MSETPITTITTMPAAELWFRPASDLAKPLQVISDNEALLIQGAVKKAEALATLDNAEAFKQASALLNELGRCRAYVKKSALDKGRPFRDESDRIKAMGETHLNAITPLEKKISDLMVAFRAKEEQERQRLIAEAQRLAEEAKQRQEVAAQAVETAADEKGFEQAAEAFGDGMAAAELAKESASLVGKQTRAKGTKEKKTVTILAHDLANVPRQFLMLDEAKLKKAIEMDLVTDEHKWVTFKIDTGFTGTGR